MNTSLRGVSLAWDNGTFGNDPANLPTQAQLNSLSKDYGLNSIHVYLEQEYQQIGRNAWLCDQLVDRASEAGLYVIITIGCGNNNGSIRDMHWCQQFWGFYAPRYANRTHVIYESHNEPGPYNPARWGNSDWENQVTLYNAIRPLAPNTHIMTCSFMSFNDGGKALEGISYMKNHGVNFSNASVAFHGYETMESVEACISTFQRGNGGTSPALICTEFDPLTTDSGYVNMIETHFIGWVQFKFLIAENADLAWLKDHSNQNGIIWTPDFGNWPAHSATQEPINAKIKLKAQANGKFVCAENWGERALIANQWSGADWETFTLHWRGTNLVALQAQVNQKYVCADGANSNPLIANRQQPSHWETFEWYFLPNGNIALRSCANGKLVSADNWGNSPLIAKQTALGQWEQFRWTY